MKLRVELKDYNTIDDAVRTASGVSGIDTYDIYQTIDKWIRDAQYIIIEFDLDNGTASVVPVQNRKRNYEC